MQNLIRQAHLRLLRSGKTIATAESCTGGLLSSLLTQLPDSSRYFILGLTTYSNKVKENILRIPASVIHKKGAVSKETALLMAQNVRKLAKAGLGISITGIAGPGGGTARKPVGTVFIAVSAKNKNTCKKSLFKGNRNSVRNQATMKALQLLKNFINIY